MMTDTKKKSRNPITTVSLIYSSAAAVILVVIIIIYAHSKTNQIFRTSETETEYQATILAERINRVLENVDVSLRLISVLTENSPNWPEDMKVSIDRQIRDELLLNREISFLAVLDEDGSVIWKSIDAPEAGFRGYSDAVKMHADRGQKFNMSDRFFVSDDKRVIILSRTAITDSGIRAIILAAVEASSLIPSKEDPYFENTHFIGLLNTDFNILTASDNNSGTDKDLSPEDISEKLKSVHASDGLSGGIYMEHGRDWVLSRMQVRSFPYYAVILNMFDEQISSCRLQLIGISSSAAALLTLILLSGILIQQKKSRKAIETENITLERINNELKELNNRKELLIKEVHHRVKNNLTMIASIINIIIQNGGPFDEQTLESLEMRISAIADIHEQLYKKGENSCISIEDYLEDLVGKTLSAVCPFDINLKVEIEPITLSDRKAGYLGIIITEILTNAVKYGLEPGSSLIIQGRTKDNTYELSVANSGKPYREGNKGLGSILIEALTEQLDAELILETGEQTRYVLKIQLPTSSAS